jgi:thymidylate synthase
VLGSAPAKTMIVYTVRSAISQTAKSLNRNKVGSRYTVPTLHGLRKYFNMVMKIRENTNLSLCEKLMGHSVTVSLDNHYLPVTKEQLFAEYKRAIPELTISNDERNNLLIENQKQKLSELEELKKENEEIKEGKLDEFFKKQIDQYLKDNDAKLIRELDKENDMLRKENESLKDKSKN